MLLDPRPPDARTGTDLADRVSQWFGERMAAGKLRPGQWLSENEVAAQLGVSRSPVREVIRMLARDGLVEVRHGIGTIVAELSSDEMDDIYQARKLVDPEMVRLAIEQMTDQHVDQLAVIVDDMRIAFDDRDYPAFASGTLRFYQLLMDLCPNRAIREMVAMAWRRTNWVRGSSYRNRAAIYGVRLDTAHKVVKFASERDAEAAHAAMVEDIENVRRLRQRAEGSMDTHAEQHTASPALVPSATADTA